MAPGAPLLLEGGALDPASPEAQAAFRLFASSATAPVLQRLSARGTAPWLVQIAGAIREDRKAALEKTGVFGQLTKLGKNASLLKMAGVDRDSLTDSVTDQAMGGIFTYIGAEEKRLRSDPLSAGKSILQGLGKK